MIDLHCHILPCLDDGPKSIYESLDMAKNAVKAGITHLFATPHHRNGQFSNTKNYIIEQVLVFNSHLMRENIHLLVYPGQELRLHREIFISIEKDEVLTLDNKGRYLLLELPSGEVPSYTLSVIYELLLKGITPIIVHPERNMGILEDPNLLFEMVKEGALTQLTSGSIIGHFGKRVRSVTEKMIEHNLAHFIATDAHLGSAPRGFDLQEAYEAILKGFGSDKMFFFRENAELLLTGINICTEEPFPIRKKIFGMF